VTYDSGSFRTVSVVGADVNEDGRPDLLVANQCTTYRNKYDTCSGSSTVGVLLGNGDGTFQTLVTYSSGGYLADSLTVGDVNGDGKLDVLVANRCARYLNGSCGGHGKVSVLLGNGDGAFQTAVTYGSGGYLAIRLRWLI
jgi:hypothetical protein